MRSNPVRLRRLDARHAAVLVTTLVTAVAVVAAVATGDSAPPPPPAGTYLPPGRFPQVTIGDDVGRTEALLFSSCTSTLSGGACADGILTGDAPTLRTTRGTPLTVHVEGAGAPAVLTVHDRVRRSYHDLRPDETVAALPPGTAQFTPPRRFRTGSDIIVAVRWDAPGWSGEASYGLRLFFRGELAPSHVEIWRLLRRSRNRPPLLRVWTSHAGRLTVHWRSGRRAGGRTLAVGAGRRWIALTGVPGHPTHRTRVRVALRPAERRRPRSAAHTTFHAA